MVDSLAGEGECLIRDEKAVVVLPLDSKEGACRAPTGAQDRIIA